jgi:hypothetical protein
MGRRAVRTRPAGGALPGGHGPEGAPATRGDAR